MSVPPGYPMLLVHHFFDNNGDNAAGYKLYTYAAGTSTPKETFQDSDLTTPNTNPITLDAFGRCTIFVCGGEGYKIKLFTPEGDPGGILIWTRDNWSVPGVSAPEAAAEIPIGGMIPYGGAAAPTGWLLCNGAAVSRATYAGLFAVSGTNFGVGDGSTTFNVPNLKLGRVPAGQDASLTDFTTLGQTGGSIGSNMPTHSHTLSATGGTGAETGHNHSHDHGLTNHNHGGGTGVHAHTVSGCVQTSTSGHLHDNTGQQFASRPTGAISFMNAGDPPTNSVGVANSPQGGNDTSGSSGHTHSLTGSTDATTGVNNNLPPYIVMRYLIRV